MAVLWSQILVVIALLSTCLSFQRSGIMGAQRWIQSTSRPSFIPLAQTLLQATESEESALGMPDNMKFAKYYSSIVADGEEMNQMQFLAYEEVLDFLAKGLVYEDDLYDLWLSATGDATGLNLEEAYEMLCMVYDLPDPEDIQFYDEEFQKLSGGTDSLNFNQVLEWKDIQDMISAKVLDRDDITEIWREVVGDLDAEISRDVFGKLNQALDEAIDELEEDLDSEDMDDFFLEAAGEGKESLSFVDFMQWEDIQFIVNAKVLTEEEIAMIWKKAIGPLDVDIGKELFVKVNQAIEDAAENKGM